MSLRSKNYVHIDPATAAQPVHATVPVQLPAPQEPATNRSRNPRNRLSIGIVALAVVALAVFLSVRSTNHTPTQSQHSPPHSKPRTR